MYFEKLAVRASGDYDACRAVLRNACIGRAGQRQINAAGTATALHMTASAGLRRLLCFLGGVLSRFFHKIVNRRCARHQSNQRIIIVICHGAC